jgi:hypothetical protein
VFYGCLLGKFLVLFFSLIYKALQPVSNQNTEILYSTNVARIFSMWNWLTTGSLPMQDYTSQKNVDIYSYIHPASRTSTCDSGV